MKRSTGRTPREMRSVSKYPATFLSVDGCAVAGRLCYEIQSLNVVEMIVIGVKIASNLHCNGGNPNVIHWNRSPLPFQHLEYMSIVIACLERYRAFFHSRIKKEIIQRTEILHPLSRGCNASAKLAKDCRRNNTRSYDITLSLNASGLRKYGMRIFVSKRTRFISTSPRQSSPDIIFLLV